MGAGAWRWAGPGWVDEELQCLSPNSDFVCALHAKSLQSCPIFANPQTGAHQAPPSVEFSRQEYWSGLPCPPPGDLPDSGIEPWSPALTGRFFTAASPGKTWVYPGSARSAPHLTQILVLSPCFLSRHRGNRTASISPWSHEGSCFGVFLCREVLSLILMFGSCSGQIGKICLFICRKNILFPPKSK